jgi:hypothetical protein
MYMNNVKKPLLALFTAALLLGATRVTLAQSSYTTGTAESNASAGLLTLAQSTYTTGTADSSAAAGLPTPSGYGGDLYAYVPNYGYGRAATRRSLRRNWIPR